MKMLMLILKKMKNSSLCFCCVLFLRDMCLVLLLYNSGEQMQNSLRGTSETHGTNFHLHVNKLWVGIQAGLIFCSLAKLYIFIAVIESILGTLGNGFIGLVNCIDCVKNKKCSVIGLILIGLATSRIFLIWIIITDGFIRILSPHIYSSGSLIEYMSYLWIIINHSSVWFATSLSIFYFLRIANFSHYIFLWLKHRINKVLLLLIGLLLISWLLSFPQVVKIINDYKAKNGNRTWHFMIPSEYLIYEVALNVGVIFFFMLSLVTCFLLIISLWRHNRHMQLNALSVRDPSSEAHVRAMKVLLSFITLFTLNFIGLAIEISCFIVPEKKWLMILGMTTSVLYPWGHSFILIAGNSKLKQASLKLLQLLKCCGERSL